MVLTSSTTPCSSTRRSFHSLLAQSYSPFQIIDTVTSFRERRRALSERSESKGKETSSEANEVERQEIKIRATSPFYFIKNMPIKFYVYILKNSENKLYIGQTESLEKRLKRHQQFDGAKYTKVNKNDFKLVYFEEYNTRKEAMNRELQIKKWSRVKKDALIEKDYSRTEITCNEEIFMIDFH